MNSRVGLILLISSFCVQLCVSQMTACTTDGDCGSVSAPRGLCINGFCSCKSGFGGSDCQSRPDQSCAFDDVSATTANLQVTPLVQFLHPNLHITIDLNLEENSFLAPSANDSDNSLPYSTQTYIIFGNGSFPSCNFPNNAVNWTDAAASASNCKDRYSLTIR